MEEKESEEEGAKKEQWSSPEEREVAALALAANLRDPWEVVFGPVRIDNEAEGTVKLVLQDNIVAIEMQAIFFLLPSLSLLQ